MSRTTKTCHGQFDCLEAGSTHLFMNRVFKVYQGVRSYLVWYVENMGLWGTLKHILRKTGESFATQKNKREILAEKKQLFPNQETLNLKPGELVEVKSVEEILSTLDRNRRNKGLRWMTGMRKYCGRRYRVLKRVEKILLESNGELRRMKNTVLLEGVMCDGSEFCGCDRSCFHYWREVWLRRVVE